jgi:hypothetical protein
MNSNDALFYTSLYTFLGGFVLALAGLLYKSKCKNIKCCGCELERDIEAEVTEDTLEIQNRNQSIDRTPNNPIRT